MTKPTNDDAAFAARMQGVVENVLGSITTLVWHQIRLRYDVTMQNIRTAPEILTLVIASQLNYQATGRRDWTTYEDQTPAANIATVEQLVGQLYPEPIDDQEADKSMG